MSQHFVDEHFAVQPQPREVFGRICNGDVFPVYDTGKSTAIRVVVNVFVPEVALGKCRRRMVMLGVAPIDPLLEGLSDRWS